MIDVEGLTKIYGRHGTKALEDVSFSVPAKSVFGFLGPNGAGKTTTIRILATVLAPTKGTIRIDGHDVRSEPIAVKERLGLMPDEVAFYPNLTGRAHLLYYASFHKIPRAEARKRAAKGLEDVGIADAADRRVREYSHGMKKRLALAQCLLHNPDVLIMDEPANGLDPAGMRYFRDLIRWLNSQGKTIFLSSHLLHEVEQLCDRVCIINRGKVLAVDSIAGLGSRLNAGAPSVLHVTATEIPDSTIEAIRWTPGVAAIERTAVGLDAKAQSGADIAPEVARALVAGGARIQEMRREQRSLEDLFLALTRGEGS